MSSREEILANIRKNTQKRFDYPEWEIKATTYPDIIAVSYTHLTLPTT